MKNLNLFLLIVVFSCSAHSKSCNVFLGELANAQRQFVSCNTHHAISINDVRLCGGCQTYYTLMVEAYNKLMSIENCSKIYLDADRMNIVSTTQKVLTGLWSRAYCDDCFKNNNMDNLNEMHFNLTDCMHYNQHQECTKCMLQYDIMNTYYHKLDEKNNGQMCFDMLDMMNRTRMLWSKELKCCQREVKMQTFLITVGFVSVLPIVLFYTVAVVLTKRREANHGLLNEEQPELDAHPSTSTLITAAVLSTPTEPPTVVDARIEKVSNVLTLDESETSSDDDESALRPKMS